MPLTHATITTHTPWLTPTDSKGKINLLLQLLKAAVGPNRIEPGINSEMNKILVAFLKRLAQPFECRVTIVQRKID